MTVWYITFIVSISNIRVVLLLRTDRCSPHGEDLCKHGGRCLIQDTGHVKCDCSVLFEGQHCEISKLQLLCPNNFHVVLYLILFLDQADVVQMEIQFVKIMRHV